MKKIIGIIGKTMRNYSDNEMNVYSGYASLYILTAMIPLLMLVITVVNLMPGFSGVQLAEWFFERVPLIEEVQDLLKNVIMNLSRQSSGMIASVSALTTLWSASNGISAVQKGLLNIENGTVSFFKGRVIALIYTILFIILIPALLIFQVFGSSIGEMIAPVLEMLNLVELTDRVMMILNMSGILVIALMVFIIVLSYTFLPGEKRKLRTQLPGAIFTSVLWIAFSAGFAYFIPRFWKASAIYGSLAAVFLSIMWLKIIVAILFYGAALNKALEDEACE